MVVFGSTGLLLVGHGTRDRRGLAEFQVTARRVQQLLPAMPVQPAYLELAQPDVLGGIDRLVERRVTRIVVVPLLLFAAGHAKRDIPEGMMAARRRYTGVDLGVSDIVGSHRWIRELSEARYRDCLRGEPGAARRVRWVMVVRGTSDEEAKAEIEHYGTEMARRLGVDWSRVAYMAAARPRLAEALGELAWSDDEMVIVQPHLLFRGDVLSEVQEQVAAFARRHPATQWRIARHLGTSPRVAEVVAELAGVECPASAR
jgi:sirohydrochlorin cobaltochelatase